MDDYLLRIGFGVAFYLPPDSVPLLYYTTALDDSRLKSICRPSYLLLSNSVIYSLCSDYSDARKFLFKWEFLLYDKPPVSELSSKTKSR
jgi:hypothetical protein